MNILIKNICIFSFVAFALSQQQFINQKLYKQLEFNQKQQEPAYKEEIPYEKLPFVQELAFSLWFKFSYRDPATIPLRIIRKSLLAVAGITENSDWTQTENYGDIAASFWIGNFQQYSNDDKPSYYFSTYSLSRQKKNNYQIMNIDPLDFDSCWNWIYFGYSFERKKAFAYVLGGRTGQSYSLIFGDVSHNNPAKSLKFNVASQATKDYYVANGYVHGIFFDYQVGAYRDSQHEIQKYFKYYANDKNPIQIALPYKLNVTVKGLALQNHNDQNQKKDYIVNEEVQFDCDIKKPTFQQQFYSFSGEEDYAVHGWLKWVEPNDLQAFYTVFRLTINEPEYQSDKDNEGDRALTCLVGQGNLLSFSTYSIGLTGDDQPYINRNLNNVNLNNWVWLYMGYSYQKGQVFAHVKFFNQELEDQTIVINNVRHIVPKFFGLFLGQDSYQPQFNGLLKKWFFRIGNDAFQTEDYEQNFMEGLPIKQCIIVYDQCQFKGNQIKLCEDSNYKINIDKNTVEQVQNNLSQQFTMKSVEIGKKLTVEIIKDGIAQEITDDISCVDQLQFNLLQLGVHPINLNRLINNKNNNNPIKRFNKKVIN